MNQIITPVVCISFVATLNIGSLSHLRDHHSTAHDCAFRVPAMRKILTPLQLIIVATAGWLNRHQADVVDYLIEQVRVLQELQGGKCPRLNDDQRRRLAVKGKAVGRKGPFDTPTIVRPDTILGWHRKLVAIKHDYSKRRRGPGRPGILKTIRELMVRFAKENPSWGYTRIMGALENVGHTVGRTTIVNVLRAIGIVPAPEQGERTRWRDFLRAHWDVLAARVFFTVDVWTMRGLRTYYVLFFIELSTRRVEIAGITPNPDGAFMVQVACNLTDAEDGFLRDKRYLIHDRDTKFTDDFIRLLAGRGGGDGRRMSGTSRWTPQVLSSRSLSSRWPPKLGSER